MEGAQVWALLGTTEILGWTSWMDCRDQGNEKWGKSEKFQLEQGLPVLQSHGDPALGLSPHAELRSHLHQLLLKSVGTIKANRELEMSVDFSWTQPWE